MKAKLGTSIPHARPRSISEQQMRDAFLHQENKPGMITCSETTPFTVAPHVASWPEDTSMWCCNVDRGDMLPQSRWPPSPSQPYDEGGNCEKTLYLAGPSLKSRKSLMPSDSPSSQLMSEACPQNSTSRMYPPYVEDHHPTDLRYEETWQDDRVPGPSRYVPTMTAGYREPAQVITTSSTQFNPQLSSQIIFRQQASLEQRLRDSGWSEEDVQKCHEEFWQHYRMLRSSAPSLPPATAPPSPSPSQPQHWRPFPATK